MFLKSLQISLTFFKLYFLTYFLAISINILFLSIPKKKELLYFFASMIKFAPDPQPISTIFLFFKFSFFL